MLDPEPFGRTLVEAMLAGVPVIATNAGAAPDILEGGKAVDHGDYLTLHSPQNPLFWWGNFLLMPESALHDQADKWMSRFAKAFPGAAHVAIGVAALVHPPGRRRVI